MNLKEAAQQALEYLEQHAIISGAPIRDALRAALEPVTTCHELSKEGDKLSLPFNHFPDARKMVATILPEVTVEPVAWMVYTEGGTSAYVTDNPNDLVGAYRALPLYSSPPQREPLTAPQIHELDWPDDVAFEDILEFTRAIERAHGIGGEE